MTTLKRPIIELDPSGFNEMQMCRVGPMLYNRNDVYVGGSLKKYGEFSWIETQLFQQLLRPGQFVVEVGANIGAHTVDLSNLVGSGGSVVAFEPQRIVFQALCANLALNQCTNVHAFQQALGAENGEIRVPSMNPSMIANFGGVSLLGAGHGELVPVRTLDDFRLPACHFLKADVEGMEIEVLAGARETIKRYRPILYMENDRKERSKELLESVFGLNYNAYWHLPPLFNPENFAKDLENVFPGIVSVNILCVPSEATVTLDGFHRVISPEDDWQIANRTAANRAGPSKV